MRQLSQYSVCFSNRLGSEKKKQRLTQVWEHDQILSNDKNTNLFAGLCGLLEASNKLRIWHLHLISYIYSFQSYLTSSEHKFLTSEMLILQSKKSNFTIYTHIKSCNAILEFPILFFFYGKYFGFVSFFYPPGYKDTTRDLHLHSTFSTYTYTGPRSATLPNSFNSVSWTNHNY